MDKDLFGNLETVLKVPRIERVRRLYEAGDRAPIGSPERAEAYRQAAVESETGKYPRKEVESVAEARAKRAKRREERRQ